MATTDNKSHRPTTAEWAESFGISAAPMSPVVGESPEPWPFTARDIAVRAIVLHGVTAVACDVEPEPVVEWFEEQHIWDLVSPREQAFLRAPRSVPELERQRLRWRQECEGALLWTIRKVQFLGLPLGECDTRRLVDEIIPELSSEIEPFLSSAVLRSPGELLAEDSRRYNLWCYYFQTRRNATERLPADLLLEVLYQSQYAFEWLHGIEAWDDVQCDA